MSQSVVPALTIYLDERTFEAISAAAYQQYSQWLKFSIPAVGDFEVTEPPRIHLLADGKEDICVTFEVRLGFEKTVLNLAVTLFAKIVADDQRIKLEVVRVKTDSGFMMLNALINAAMGMLFEHLASTYDMRLPSPHAILGVHLNARLLGIRVVTIDGEPVLETTASVGVNPLPHAPMRLHRGHGLFQKRWAEGTIEAIIPQHAANSAVGEVFTEQTIKVHERMRCLAVVIHLRMRVLVDKVKLKLRDDDIDAAARMNVRKLRVSANALGLPVPTRLPLRVKEVDADVDVTLRAEHETRAVLILDDIEEVDLSFKESSGVLGVPLRFFERLLDDAVGYFTTEVSDELSGKKAELFSLPQGSARLPLDVRFVDSGLSVRRGEIGGCIRVLPPPGMDVVTPGAPPRHGPEPVQVNFVERGNGRPIVFVHGWSLDLTYWNHQLTHFSQGYRCICYDWRGMGKTPGGDLPYDMEQHSLDLLGFLDARGIDRAMLCGHSFGGDIILRFAVDHPDRVAALLCADTPSPGENPPIDLQIDSATVFEFFEIVLHPASMLDAVADTFMNKFWSHPFRDANPQIMAEWRAQWVKNSPISLMMSTMAQRTRQDLRKRIPARVTCPGQVICGDSDALVTAADAKALYDLFRRAPLPLYTVPSSGHMSPCEQPKAFNTAMRAFLQKVYPVS